MTSYWWTDRALPGIVSSLIMAVVLGVSHVLLKRHVTRVARAQTRDLKGEAGDRSGR